jgi:signal transduction histidine kinase
LKVLEHKHRLSLEFASDQGWELLTARLAELPGRIADVAEAFVLVRNPISGKFQTVSHWTESKYPSGAESWDPSIPCKARFERVPDKRTTLHRCGRDIGKTMGHAYSLEINGQDLNTTLLKFRLGPGGFLSEEEKEIFLSIGDEIVAALRASRDRQRVSDLQSAQVAMAERRMVSAYVHDRLGQNLGYMHLRLDQLSKTRGNAISKGLNSDLEQLRRVANESYEIVRDILKNMQPETVPHLTNMLKEHAKKISLRAGFFLDFKSTGTPIRLVPEVQQTILYTFFEILNNIEKHSNAERVEIMVSWNEGLLSISVSDNGIGFDSQAVRDEKHFGMEIMQERIAKLNGSLTIDSATASGTLVSITVPLQQSKEAALPYEQ